MGAVASLSSRSLVVEPGSQVTFTVKVRNDGSVVDELTFSVVGESNGWASAEPPSLSLFPGAEGSAQITFAPPRSPLLAAGMVPFGVRVASREDPAGSVVEEGTVELSAFHDLTAELVPKTSRGRRVGLHDLALDNRGNARVHAALSATDPDNLLAFAITPEELIAEPGTATFAKVKVAPRKRFWRGSAQTRPFQVLVESNTAPPIVVDGTMLQEPMLPPWLPRALMALLAALLLLLLLWLTILRPQIRSAAKDAVADESAKAAADGTKGGGPSDGKTTTTKAGGGTATTTTAGGTDTTGGGTTTTTGGATTTTTGVQAGDGRGPNIDGRLSLKSAGVVSFKVPEGKTLRLTDIVLQNPGGNTGTLTVQRDGVALLVVALENFRDLDYHFVTPILFTSGQKLELAANCTSPACTPGLYYLGNIG